MLVSPHLGKQSPLWDFTNLPWQKWSFTSQLSLGFLRDQLTASLGRWDLLSGSLFVQGQFLISEARGFATDWECLDWTADLSPCPWVTMGWTPQCPDSLLMFPNWAGLGAVLSSWEGLWICFPAQAEPYNRLHKHYSKAVLQAPSQKRQSAQLCR